MIKLNNKTLTTWKIIYLLQPNKQIVLNQIFLDKTVVNVF